MKKLLRMLAQAFALLALFQIQGCKTSSHQYLESDIYFLPCETNAIVSFEGRTQMGDGIHHLEVRRLAYFNKQTKSPDSTINSAVIYYAGEEYGPSILLQIEDCICPLVTKVSSNVVEIYYITGAHTHIRQRWKLLEATAELEKKEAIEWYEDPREKKL